LDGLRAIAVWAVVVFHLSRNTLPGGYLGVDIFFVLSGYLITAILWRDSLRNQFSIVKFYDRRIRRIMPALMTVLAVTTLASAVLLLPSDLIGYGKSLLSSLAFVANIYFWRDTDYFAAIATTKPLLHLWSLGVEEQFYILYPWLIALLVRFRKGAALPVIGAIIVASLLAEMFLEFKGGSSPAFFLLPTRMWELGIGGFLAIMPSTQIKSRIAAQILSLVGAAMIAIPMLDPTFISSPIPVAVYATLGTAFVLFAGNGPVLPIFNRLLSSSPFVFFGLISYSLYLWHWPVIVLGQYYLVREFQLSECIIAIVFMVLAAYVSWRYIERPFRSKTMPIVKVRIWAGLAAAVLAAAGLLLILAGGLPWRLNKQAALINEAVGTHYRCSISDYLPFGGSRACVLNLPSRQPQDADVVLLGNSHAQMYAPIISDILQARGLHGLLVPINYCLPIVKTNLSTGCITAAQKNLDQISQIKHAHTVIIAMTWRHTELTTPDGRVIENRENRPLIEALDDLISKIEKSGKKVVLIGPIVEPGWEVASDVSRNLVFGHAISQPLYTPASSFNTQFGTVFAHFQERKDVRFVRPDAIQCHGDRCDYILDGHSLFSDSSHLARQELYRFRRPIEAALPD
jgi:Predicted acyltransferases